MSTKLCPTDQYGGTNGTTSKGGACASLTPYPKGTGDELGLIARSLLKQAEGLRQVISDLRALTESVKHTHGV